ncbi:MAG: glycosyltransferase 2 family protein [Thermotogaceae bacterium]|nr:glycosyltransferase 2 family protein [Thermotogaceae bacterium]
METKENETTVIIDSKENDLSSEEKKSVSFKWLMVSVILGLIVVIGFFFIGDFQENIAVFKSIDLVWFAISGICLLIFWLSESLTIYTTAKISGVKLSLWKAIETNMVGQFYNSVTPFASGGQPMQILRLYRLGIDVSKATAVLISRFLIYQTTITILGVFIMFVFFDKINSLPSISILAVFGFLINSAVIFFLLIFSFSPLLTRKIFDLILFLVSPFKFGKKMKKSEEQWITKIGEFHSAMKNLGKAPFKLFIAFLFTSIQIFFYFSIPYCIYRMLEPPTVPFSEIFSFQGILFLIISFVPVPGAGGAAEGGFYLFFKNFFAPSNIAGAVILWRIMSYYMNIFIGAPFAMKIPKKKKV